MRDWCTGASALDFQRMFPDEAACGRYLEELKRLGYDHERAVTGGDPEINEAVLPLIHLVFSNLKAWLLGTHHGVSHRPLQAYLNEYVFRFNRRFYPMGMFNSVLGIATRVEGPTYAVLYDGKWDHPNNR